MTAARLAATDLQISAGRRRREGLVRLFFLAAAVLSIVISLAIVLSLAGNALTFFVNVDKSALWTDGWFPRRGLFDIKTIVAGTLVISLTAMLVATPLGLGAGIFLSEYATPRVRRLLKPAIEVLASIPSVVLGFFALTWISPNIVQTLTGAPLSNMATAGIAVGILITPLIASISEDALHAVPNYLREASYGLGARRRTTTLRVVFPAAVSGVVAALILGVSRAIGETMIVALAAGRTPAWPPDPTQPMMTLTTTIVNIATGEQEATDFIWSALFAIGALLFVITLTLNVASHFIVKRFRELYE